ncbi:MAG TPA: M23 family metallopeptidase [Blastocatellia bacterium]|jgi:murein DD-endopeptidase MepM/ murein hydrolase activator NlpD|nr:M23 family metallopeptidase [Blastocatellia bacterium]
MAFPLEKLRPLSYKQRPGRFGNNRSGGRLHAGCDLYAPAGTPILAVADGVVELYNPYFYQGTGELQIKHAHFTARYCEISGVPEGISKGVSVREGQVIAYVGKMTKVAQSMLHFELYSGVDKNGRPATGSLTNRKNPPYMRRSDLIDPTPYLDLWKTSWRILGLGDQG